MGDAKAQISVRSRFSSFTAIDNVIIRKHFRSINGNAFKVWCVLRQFADYQDGTCFPYVSTIAEMAGVGRNTVYRSLSELVASKFLELESGKKTGKANSYVVTYPDHPSPKMGEGCPILGEGVSQNGGDNKEQQELTNKNQLTHTPSESQRSKVDERHRPFQDLIFRCYQHMNHSDPSWDASDAKQLALLLKATPQLTEDRFRHWLWNYSQSKDITPSARPRTFLPRIADYGSGPRNEFRRVIKRQVSDDGPSPGVVLRKQLAEENRRKGLV
jgi:hypothetical protein